MGRKKVHLVEEKRDINREHEVLDAKVKLSGAGEDQVIKDLLSPDFATMPDEKALGIQLALQQIIRGQAALLSNQSTLGTEISDLRTKFAKYDEDDKKWQTDRKKFIEDLYNKADKLTVTDPEKKAELEGKIAVDMKRISTQAHADGAHHRLTLEQSIASQSLVEVTSPGIPVLTNQGGMQTVVIMPEVIRLGHKQWVLQPGVPTKVPQMVATRLEQIRLLQAENSERKLAISASGVMKEASVVARDWTRINQKYQSSTEPM